MGVLDFLFGKQYFIKDEKIGVLKARFRNSNPSINHTWTGEHKLKSEKKKTVFILEGNCNGPYKQQLQSAHEHVDSLEKVKDQIKIELNGIQSTKDRYKKNWINDFYLSAITPNDINNNSFEVNFEPFDENDTSYVLFVWNNGKISEIESK